MGVLGLTPFLQKTCPEVIKRLPDRLRGLRGKTVVVDGTLITQRLHFANIPHPQRHVLGWYRLAKEFKDCGVHAICVFDGKERSFAKARENERRREVRRMDTARGAIEAERLRRLQKLSGLLQSYRSLEVVDRERTSSKLRKLVLDAKSPTLPSTPSGDIDLNERLSWSSSELRGISDDDVQDILLNALAQSTVAHNSFEPDQINWPTDEGDCAEWSGLAEAERNSGIDLESPDASRKKHDSMSSQPHITLFGDPSPQGRPKIEIRRGDGIPDSTRSSHHAPSHTVPEYCPTFPPGESPQEFEHQHLLLPDNSPGSLLPSVHPSDARPFSADSGSLSFPEDIVSALPSLYLEYRRSIPQLTSLATTTPVSPIDPSEARAEYAMSKSQYQLTLEEGRLWDELASADVGDNSDASTKKRVSTLEEKSTLLSDSYDRRSNPPTAQTYDESREILRAMGTPCIDSSGPFEAEALASALVLHGCADYVASEDTDVLVYEAPLIRNITNRRGPLVVVNGSDVRTVLQLDRASYIDFALLLGTDFSQRIKNVGPQRALKFIRQYGSIEQVVEHEKQYPPRESMVEYLERVAVARLVFQTLPPIPDPELLRPGEIDDVQVLEILDRFGLSRMAMHEWNHESALAGNYFYDNPHTF
ncbi:hypothetical protein PLICRDRAFT_95239 [Plicaturopsis crispa FD-325 SS-3]|uniref:PIN domain-like protein n=1 Tax=Plicaturopsis crispa FD-325 SS-3 TaxID=944288 RepID=A0A0C9T4P2_PLICR|nr:hypothetical protein PLICRDRAFT_95239 [Plicaturopsis crispa FD-325 SS-3]